MQALVPAGRNPRKFSNPRIFRSCSASILPKSLDGVRNAADGKFSWRSNKSKLSHYIAILLEVSMPSWQIAGDYFETCSCDYVCPCIPTNLAGKPTKEWCNFAMVFHIDKGHSDGTNLDGLT